MLKENTVVIVAWSNYTYAFNNELEFIKFLNDNAKHLNNDQDYTSFDQAYSVLKTNEEFYFDVELNNWNGKGK